MFTHYLVIMVITNATYIISLICILLYLFSPQGKKFVGDLLNDGKIRWVETGQIFNSPSAWATHCKRLVNPAKKSGCGWASVRYRGQKLVQYKTSWLHKYQPSADKVGRRKIGRFVDTETKLNRKEASKGRGAGRGRFRGREAL